MLYRTDCDVRFASHARQIARVNATEWMRPARLRTTRITLCARLGSVLITLGDRLTPRGASADVVLASSDQA
jgi:hypothetical protein